MTFTKNYSKEINRLKKVINEIDTVIIGAGAGLSTSAGLTYSGERFKKHFSDFISKYHFADMYSATFYPYSTLEEYWAYMSRHIYYNRFEPDAGKPYCDLFEIVKDKDYFVITTNVDHQFQKTGFDKHRLFYTQGDYGLWQCSDICHNETYDNEEIIYQMVKEQRNFQIPTDLIPYCSKCGKPMSMNLRCDDKFAQDKGWYIAYNRYEEFIRRHGKNQILYLEFGVGNNTPAIIKYPFWQMTAQNPKAIYSCVNFGEAFSPKEITSQSICINDDIGEVLKKIISNE